MMRLDTDPMTPGRRTARRPVDPMPLLIQVPRIAEPAGGIRSWRPAPARPTMTRSSRGPRRRLRRGVRRAACSLLVLAAMAGTFAMGWTTRGGPPRPAILTASASATARDPGELGPTAVAAERPSGAAPADPADVAAGPGLGAPVVDMDVPVVFPGYLLPDNTREESAHEGS